VGSRGLVWGTLIAALIVTEVAKDITFSMDHGEWLPAWSFLYGGILAGMPFLLAKFAPRAAGFNTQWLPNSRRQWAWFVGMIILVIVSKLLVCMLAAATGPPPPSLFIGPVSPTGIVLSGIVIVFIGPIAEEIFFRGYVLEQLRKHAHSSIALLIHALLFGLFHLYTWGWYMSLGLFKFADTFLFGLILGAWRIKYRSLLPLVLVHILINYSAIVNLKARYDRTKCHVPISMETTLITGPLCKNSYPDYVAVLNQRYSNGVTPENNSAVLHYRFIQNPCATGVQESTIESANSGIK
jgi:membrane protease YdiL (CAAX protease family)